ncbi:MAG: CBS domain-containing protein [Nitrospirae bacterium]|nr:CBS domain-containing protein [Candidatus Troglogloeales bacterium]MBI3598257.1 CBS domain-containing protein [Candidatus Troglogloeales bacterium]
MTPLALLMHREMEQIAPAVTLREAAEKMRDKKVGALIVCESGNEIAIISEVDFVRKAVAMGLNMATTSVREIMSSPLITIDIDQSAQEANELMAEKRIRHLLVTSRGKVIGIISMRDLVLCFKNRL